jgi:hypothetical protein
MRLTQSLTDPVTVAFISILILIWLNKWYGSLSALSTCGMP